MNLGERKVPFIQLLRLEKNQQFTKSTYSTGVIELCSFHLGLSSLGRLASEC